MDVNGDNSLSKDEIRLCCEQSHLPPEKIEEFLNLFDKDGDDNVTLDEYERALCLKPIPETTAEHWREAFDEMDKDKSGKLTVDELYEGLKNAGCGMKRNLTNSKRIISCNFRRIEHWQATFNEMDVDKSGKLTIDEMYQGLLKSGCELSKDRIESIVKSADDDGDRSLTFKEFCTLKRL
ncbi:unnamed protein product [Rodentolepis nana]|uniref:EF-hand domain-containing protein n=1 Tax=Rodentolepis nana TaxID=102285 RepID=A0A158QH21_RODNA|nr:unnamed protein product [Rodentolepis nana]